METSLMVDDYPTAPEIKTKRVSGSISMTYTFEDIEVPADWTIEDIKEDIKENMYDYEPSLDYEEVNIEKEN